MNLHPLISQAVQGGLAAVALLLLVAPLMSGEEPKPRHTLGVKVESVLLKSLAFSPDGKTFAAAVGKKGERGGPTVVRLWDVASGKNTATLVAGIGEMWSVAFSSDGKTLAAGAEGGPAKLWEVATGKNTAILCRGATRVGVPEFGPVLALSPDKKTLARVGLLKGADNPTGVVQLWDVTTDKATATLGEQKPGPACAAFSPDGKVLASGGVNPSVMLWDLKAGKSTAAHDGHADQGCFSKMFAVVFSLAFSPDGKVLASASLGGTINLWDPATGRRLATLGDKSYLMLCMAFSPDGKTLATGGMEEKRRAYPAAWTTIGVLQLWDVPTGKCLATFRDIDTGIVAVAFSPDGTPLLASSDKDGTIRLWDIPPAKRAGQ